MLRPYQAPTISIEDAKVFEAIVPRDHWVRRVSKHVDFLKLRGEVEPFYRIDVGCPGIEPVLLIKLELLMYQDNLSDTQVYKRAETDLAYRWFLGLGRNDSLPDISTLGRFRSRIGVDGHKALFHSLLKQAREHGLVKDRLRIKDATHIIADIAVPAGLTLVAQARNALLRAAKPFDEERVAGEHVRIETIRTSTDTGADESADALELVQQETTAHGNTIEQLSIDGAGYDGPVLRKLEEEHSIDVFVPPKADSQPDRFTPDQFPLNEEGSHVTCPAGQTSKYTQRDESRHTTMHRFTAATCSACPLLNQCMDQPQAHGRSVRKNDFEAEYDRVRERAKTPEYTAVKKEHPIIERSLGHLMNRYGCRRARYRGRLRVLCQLFMGATTANLKRMIRLLDTCATAALG